MNIIDLIPRFEQSFSTCEAIDDGGAVRCEHRFEGVLRSVYFFCSAKRVPSKDELSEIQERIVAPSYYLAQDASRWNHYLVFLLDSIGAGDLSVKREIEAEKSYAKKAVISIDHLDEYLNRSLSDVGSTAQANELQTTWLTLLTTAGLARVASEDSRASVIRAIRSGQRSSESIEPVDNQSQDSSVLPFVSTFEVRQFGGRKVRGDYEFGAVNLIRGPNGTGKTSLLEAVEHFFCGATRRSRGKTDIFDASMSFTDGKTRQYSLKSAAYYQAKDLKWYGRTVLRGNKLYEGFARYNFLNTDAAVELSTDEELKDLKSALSKVALGPDASNLWNRMMSFISDLGKELDPLTRQIDQLELKCAKSLAELKTIQPASPQSAARTEAVEQQLAQLGWEGLSGIWSSEAVDSPPYASLRSLVQNLPSKVPESIESARRAIRERSSAVESIVALESNLKSIKNQNSLLLEERGACERRAQKAVTLEKYLVSGFPRVQKELSVATNRLRAARARPDLMPEDESALSHYVDSNALWDASVAVALSQMDDRTTRASADLASISARRDTLLGSARLQDSLIAQLRVVGKQYAEHFHIEACPLCRTPMEAAEFASRLVDEHVSAVGQLIEQASLELSIAAADHQLVERAARALRLIAGGESHGSVRDVVIAMQQARVEVSSAALEHERIVEVLASFVSQGLSQSQWLELLETFAQVVSQSRSVDDAVSRLQAVVEEERSSLAVKAAQLAENEEVSKQQLASLAVSLGFADVDTAKEGLGASVLELQRLCRSFESLPETTKERYSNDLETLAVAARSVLVEIESLGNKIRQEKEADRLAETLRAGIEADKSLLKGAVIERDRLRAALHTLVNIREEHSLEAGLSEFLQQNLSVIQSVFSRIHVPNELQLSNLADCRLERIATKELADLSQISTGQRSALMLSIFLALNLSLNGGPPVMLIDDPVAHVDDLNALAFLDFLGDVAESGQRQVFLATADDRLANLFEKKMAFLERRFVVNDLVSRSSKRRLQ